MNAVDLNTALLIAIALLLVLVLYKMFSLNGDTRADEESSKALLQMQQQVAELSGAVKALLENNRQAGNDLKADLNRDLTNLRTVLTDQLGNTGREVRETLVTRLGEIQSDTANKLEEMRKTVDEKLHATLEQRLGESFKQVSDRLEAVHRGLGEMQTLASGVGDLKRVLTNVKSRGTWGEVQLGALIEQTLTIDQYQKNISTKPGSRDVVEFAIRLPGPSAESPVWLPVDAKFPMEDYQRLMDAQDRADIADMESAAKALESRIKLEAKTIREKYIEPPHTTDFAILFLPTEGLYAEVMRRQGLLELLQRDYRVTVAGPSTFSAMLNSLHMGFRTLAIEKRSSEIWNTLGQIKTEFGKFGEVIDATRKKLDAASKSFESVDVRTRKINKTLSGVEALPITSSVLLDTSTTDDSLGNDEEVA
ncbi:DNA recombination protein RmuC [Polynucleobacter sp. AM-7D1]|nr:DNA recombination protein RmuC [Polynucleobacter sp. AM-7D1]